MKKIKEVEQPVQWGSPLGDWWEKNLSYHALSICQEGTCGKLPVDGTYCAEHSPVFNDTNTKEWNKAEQEWQDWKKKNDR